MINGVGDKALGRVELAKLGLDRATPASRPGEGLVRDKVASPTSPAAEMAAKGAPVDSDKVAAIRAAIAEGRYPVDPEKIAERMIALDLDRA